MRPATKNPHHASNFVKTKLRLKIADGKRLEKEDGENEENGVTDRASRSANEAVLEDVEDVAFPTRLDGRGVSSVLLLF